MNLRRLIVLFTSLSLAVAFAAPAFAKGRGVREKVEWAALPAPVRATIESNSKGGKVVAIEKRSRRGTVTYSAEVKLADDKLIEIEVSEDGSLLGIEEVEPD